jgi:hypothetical protein
VADVSHKPDDAEYSQHKETDRDQPHEDHPDSTESGGEEYFQFSIKPMGPIVVQSLINMPVPNSSKMMTKLIIPTTSQLTFCICISFYG